MRVIQITLKAGENQYNTKLGAPRRMVPDSFRQFGQKYTLRLVVDASVTAEPCTFSVVSLGKDATGSYLGTAGDAFLFSNCFGEV